jgi:cephalosporin-C deacetylase
MIQLKKIFGGVVVLLFSNIVFSQTIDLTEQWKFNFDDKPSFSNIKFDDSKWQTINAGISWEVATKNNFDGIAWYRKQITLSKAMQAEAKKTGFLLLELGKMDDADETFFNGTKIGSTGKFPPAKISGYGVDRLYKVPYKLVQWGKPNIIAVRVSDWGGGGGLYEGNYTIMPLGWKQQMVAEIQNKVKTNAFAINKPADIAITYKNNSKKNSDGVVKCILKTFTDSIITTETRTINIKANFEETANFSFTNLKVGFYKVFFELTNSEGNKLISKYGFAVAPEQAIVADDKPADFDAFWNNAKQELATVVPNFKVIPKLGILDDTKFDVSLVEMQSLGNVLIRGWYVTPKGKKNIPAVLHVQGYATVMEANGGSDDFAQLYLNIRGHGNSRDNINPGFPGFLISGIEAKEKYIYRGAYMDCLRAVDFLCSRAEIDTTRIAVQGGSQGGALSFATAALDGRIKFMAPDVPFLSDFKNYFKIAGWPGNEFEDYAKNKNKSMDEVYDVLRYFDIKNLATKIHCPVFMGVGLYDDICPPAINFAAYNNVNASDKQYILYPTSGHGLPNEHYEKSYNWLKNKLTTSK